MTIVQKKKKKKTCPCWEVKREVKAKISKCPNYLIVITLITRMMQWRQSSVALIEKQNPPQPFLLHRFKLWDNFPQWDVGPFVSSASLVGLTRRCDEAYVRDASIRHVRHCSWLIWIWKCHGRGWSERETKEGEQERKMSERFHLRLKYFPWDTNFHVLTSGTAVAAWRPQTGGHTQTISLSNGASVRSDHYLHLASSYIPPFFPSCCLVRPLGWKLLKPLSFDLSFTRCYSPTPSTLEVKADFASAGLSLSPFHPLFSEKLLNLLCKGAD